MNKFYKIRAVIALICILIALCVFSIGTAVRISLIMIEKKDNILSIGNKASNTVSNNAGSSAAAFNFSKAKKLSFYYNGVLQDNYYCYEGEEGETLFPLDMLLNQYGIAYSLINSDDMVKFDLAGKSLIIKLNSINAEWGYENVVMDAASAAFDKHIYVSTKILDLFEGYTHDMVLMDNAVYLNCWPSSLNKAYEGFKLLQLSEGRLGAYSIPGNKAEPEIIKTPVPDQIYPISDTKNYLIESGGKYFLLDGRLKTKLLPTGSNAQLSGAHGQLYWFDNKKKRLYVYNIKDGVRRSYKNYISRIAKNKGIGEKYDSLYDYGRGNTYSRFDFEGDSASDIYTVIERNGKVAAEGKSQYSPDRSKLAYYVPGKGYYTANSDGTGVTFAGIGMSCYWVDNNRIIIDMGNSFYVFDTRDGSTQPVDIVRVMAGTAVNGEIFSVKERILYAGSGKDARRLFRIPWSCDYIYANTGNGPYLILSKEKNEVYCLSSNSSFIAADTGKFVNTEQASDAGSLFKDNSAVSPDKDKLVFLQNDKGLLKVNLVDLNNFKLSSLVVDSQFGEQPESHIDMFWLDDSRLVLHSSGKGWLIDLSGDTQICSWEESDSGRLLGVLAE